jgi:hypothetical protein
VPARHLSATCPPSAALQAMAGGSAALQALAGGSLSLRRGGRERSERSSYQEIWQNKQKRYTIPFARRKCVKEMKIKNITKLWGKVEYMLLQGPGSLEHQE